MTNGGAGCGIAVEDADLRTFFEKTRGGGCADSAGASGDEDSFVFQAAHAACISVRFSVLRSGTHGQILSRHD